MRICRLAAHSQASPGGCILSTDGHGRRAVTLFRKIMKTPQNRYLFNFIIHIIFAYGDQQLIKRYELLMFIYNMLEINIMSDGWSLENIPLDI